jgi:hypothetical protein
MFVEDLVFIHQQTELGKTQLSLLGPERPEAVSPGSGVVLTDLQSSIDFQ